MQKSKGNNCCNEKKGGSLKCILRGQRGLGDADEQQQAQPAKEGGQGSRRDGGAFQQHEGNVSIKTNEEIRTRKGSYFLSENPCLRIVKMLTLIRDEALGLGVIEDLVL